MHLTYAYNNETVNFRELFGLVKLDCGHLFVHHQSDHGEMSSEVRGRKSLFEKCS